jgi:hypothetical protein
MCFSEKISRGVMLNTHPIYCLSKDGVELYIYSLCAFMAWYSSTRDNHDIGG